LNQNTGKKTNRLRIPSLIIITSKKKKLLTKICHPKIAITKRKNFIKHPRCTITPITKEFIFLVLGQGNCVFLYNVLLILQLVH
jgi:hypothetical protein